MTVKDKIDSWFIQARLYFGLTKYASALRLYDKIIEYFYTYSEHLDNNYKEIYFARVYYKKALTLYYLNQYEKSIEFYDKAISVNPLYEKAFINKGIILAKLNAYDDALSSFNMAIEINDKSEISYFNIGIIYSKLERYQDALDYFNIAGKLGYEYAYLNVAIMLEKLGEIDNALKMYDKAIESNQYLEIVYLNKGNCLNRINKYIEAIEYFDKAIDILKSKEIKNTKKSDIDDSDMIEYNYIDDNSICERVYFSKANSLISLKEYDKALDILISVDKYKSVNIFNIISKFIYFIDIDKLINIILSQESFWIKEKEEYFYFVTRDIADKNKLKRLWILQYILLYLISVKDYDNIEEISHYTSIEVFDEMAFDKRYDKTEEANLKNYNSYLKKNKFRMTSVKNANDPKEGKVLMQLLRDNSLNVKHSKVNNFIALQTSFSRCKDSLTMYRLYGKNDNKEGTGCCLVFNKSFFDTSFNNINSSILFSFSYNKENNSYIESYEENTLPLYYVLYYNYRKNEIIFNPSESDYNSLIIDLNKNYHSLWNDGNDFYDKLKNKIGYIFNNIFDIIKTFNSEELEYSCQLLMNIQYLIKDSSFVEEQEMRIIQLLEYGSNPLHIDDNMKRSYKNYLYLFDNKALKEVILAPKVKDADFLVEKYNDRLAKATNIYNSETVKNKYRINVYVSNAPIS
ncbi:tetratricopeptide repeat protein [Brachyspira pilosicoli]|uniref:tetratricopeptide repeat protein n=1 Tax=Brachyspira pilosicoli TaxID=52584 RepID=UPI0030059A81